MAQANYLRLGDACPDFEADSTEGKISFHKWAGDSWVIFFSHPADYTPVCTTELGTVAKYGDQWKARGVKPIAISVDPVDSHNGWLKDIEETQGTKMNFPIVADPTRAIANSYGMLAPNAEDTMKGKLTVRSVFIIDPAKKLRLTLTYPAATGRNFDELIRVIDALQLTDGSKVATPANWKQGDDVVILPGINDEKAKEMFTDFKTLKPYLRMTKQPAKTVKK
eukprot:CAMPEP_0168522590 /NCGR_PEP_ID=MMETSP0405-20121227/9435_1 /TAXON_ID=498012 /ORGANISM="Trichosphaerium sp, Strain Am-I-7 wt" /LENGTH=222 /DNA_ID=CAMNT_0008544215 /DNA_START=26 /DNA_END=694 /DNA_ORIENTATION=+